MSIGCSTQSAQCGTLQCQSKNSGKSGRYRPEELQEGHSSLVGMALILLVALVSLTILSAETQANDKYERKSISYVPITALLGDSAKAPDLERKVFAKGMRVKLDRFDTNDLPAGIIKSYTQVKGTTTMGGLKVAIEQTIVAEVVGILETYALERAGKLVDEVDEQTFVMTKAKGLGITAADLRSIMNSAFIAIPFITKYKSNTENGVQSYSVTGGLAWYQIESQDGSYDIIFIGEVTHHGSGYSSLTETYYDKKAKKNRTRRRNRKLVRRTAMAKATGNILDRVLAKTRNLEPFKLVTGIERVDGSTIGFRLTKDMDLSLDDKFYLAEYRERSDGVVEQRKVGFAHISKVAVSNDSLSYAKVIKCGSHLTSGISMIEHPRSGLETRYGVRLKQLTYKPGRLEANGIEYLDVTGPDNQSLYLLNVGAAYNLASVTNIPQLFMNVDVMATIHDLDDHFLDHSYTRPGLFIIGGTVSVQKKYYLGAFAAGLELGGAAMYWHHTVAFKDSIGVGIAELNFATFAFAGIGAVSLEYALSIDLNFGVAASYWYGSTVTDWDIGIRKPGQEKGTSISPTNTDVPELNLTGLEFKLYFVHSIL